MKRIFAVLMVLVIPFFMSCKDETNVAMTDNNDLNLSISLDKFQGKIFSLAKDRKTLKSLKNATESEDSEQEMSEEIALYYVNSLSEEAHDVFLSLGITQGELSEFENHDIVFGALLLLDNNAQVSHDVIDCISRALIGISVTKWGIAGKITTAAVGIQFLKQVARKTLGPIGVAWTIYDFVSCMAASPEEAPVVVIGEEVPDNTTDFDNASPESKF